ncbi:hypothetical protein [Hymenobacter weizhouensis]|uniref:hypothetical protein n=1 Tax=Hymenobacter sp. YIM 151500-1 TaxID=2987689 RepID=UPI002226A796|nr:hypothetical protein [Hymenobacter sp. YIM 151500-1]UYZ64767.1 hypothetical protein OIS53_07940 [Hymenobacter sp. YIM 151500-1]
MSATSPTNNFSGDQSGNENGDNQHAPNRREGDQPVAGQQAGADAAVPNTASGTPQYGDFGHAPTSATSAQQSTPAQPSFNTSSAEGAAAPSVAFPEQRGSVPQNLDPAGARRVADAEYEEQREGWAKDDPRYGGGTRNWATNEPANRSTGPANDDYDSERDNPNDGSNDNPDEFSSLRPDEGRGIPGK